MFKFLYIALLLLTVSGYAEAKDFFVSTNGQSLSQAIEAVRVYKNSGVPSEAITVWIDEGEYYIPSKLKLTSVDSGSEQFPITYRSYPGETVRLNGAKVVSSWVPVSETCAANVDPIAKPYLMQADLSAWTENLGEPVPVQLQGQWPQAPNGNSLDLFYNGERMQLSQWPNVGNTFIEAPLTSTGQWTYSGTRPERWVGEPEILVSGFFYHDYAHAYAEIETIDTALKTIQLKTEAEAGVINSTPYPYHKYGFKAGQRYIVLNTLAEIDSPGEWYLNRTTKVLYFYPPEPLVDQSVSLSVSSRILEINGASWLTFKDLVMEGTRDTMVSIAGTTEGITFDGVTLRNGGLDGIAMKAGSSKHVVKHSKIHGIGRSGITIDAGDRATLTSGQILVENNEMYNVGTTQTSVIGININGVGTKVRHNHLHDMPHNAIKIRGNNHLVEYNKIHHVVTETSDSGAIYMGRSWTERGNIIRYNHLHDIQPNVGGAVMGIYLDDQESGFAIYGNIFERVYRGVMLGGGRYNIITNNVFIDSGFGGAGKGARLYIDGRGTKGTLETSPLYKELLTMPYTTSPWSDQYPELVGILDDAPMEPLHNRVENNVFLGTGDVSVILGAQGKIYFHNNSYSHVTLDSNYQSTIEHPERISYQQIPFQQIGTYLKPVEVPKMSIIVTRTFEDAISGTATSFNSITQTNGTLTRVLPGLNGSVALARVTSTNNPTVFGIALHNAVIGTKFRAAMRVNMSTFSIGTDNHFANVWQPRKGTAGGYLGLLRVKKVAGVLNIGFSVVDDVLGTIDTFVPLSGLPTGIEMYFEKESTDGAADGRARLFLVGGSYSNNGELVAEFTGIENFLNFSEPDRSYIGVIGQSGASSITGDFDIDDIQANDTGEAILWTVPTADVSDPGVNILAESGGSDLANWTLVNGATLAGGVITFPAQSSGDLAKASFTFQQEQFLSLLAHRFTGFVTPTDLNYPHTTIDCLVKNNQGMRRGTLVTFGEHDEHSSVGIPHTFNSVFSVANGEQISVGFENMPGQQAVSFQVSDLGVFIVV